jgi:hypothetical protein
MDLLAYSVDEFTIPSALQRPRVMELVRRAAREWNVAMRRLVALIERPRDADIFIAFGAVDRSEQPTRLAQCTRYKRGGQVYWRIVLASDVSWDAAPWWKFWARGKHSLLAALTHEFGHVFLDDGDHWHSPVAGDVMQPDLLNHLIAEDEAKRYRARFKAITHPES